MKMLSLLLVAFFSFQTWALCPQPDLPSYVELKRKIITLVPSYHIRSANLNLGSVSKKIISLTASYSYKDQNHQKVAEGREAFFSWGSRVNVVDCEGKKIGAIQENIFKSLLAPFYTSYNILDANNNVIATSEKLEWFNTKMTLKDNDQQVIATLFRPGISWTETWELSSFGGTVDSRLLIMMAVFKSEADDQKRREEEQKKKNQ